MKFAFIGSGNMASALLRGMLSKSVCAPDEVIVSGPDQQQLKALASGTGVSTAKDNREAVSSADVAVLCVKPADATAALSSLAGTLDGKLLISIVTGLSVSRMNDLAGNAVRCVRVMPNTPVMVGKGASAYAGGKNTTAADLEVVRTIFSSLGDAVEVREDQMDAVTALSGSGPAYIYLLIEAMTDAGASLGLSPELSQSLAVQTIAGAAEMVAKTGQAPSALRKMVTSPHGTTAEALGVFETRAFRQIVAEAMQAAARRAAELSKE